MIHSISSLVRQGAFANMICLRMGITIKTKSISWLLRRLIYKVMSSRSSQLRWENRPYSLLSRQVRLQHGPSRSQIGPIKTQRLGVADRVKGKIRSEGA